MGSVRCVLEASKFRMLRERVRSLDAMVIWYNIFSGTLFTIPSENIYCILEVMFSHFCKIIVKNVPGAGKKCP